MDKRVRMLPKCSGILRSRRVPDAVRTRGLFSHTVDDRVRFNDVGLRDRPNE
ncbi:hypothetical protein ABT063_07340 [Streptomyces sp. NPDC002838]|uniref:hypothetical protein n=1 Tax=Streptomyces sp. NPDC002838 TaxID=3154436 RepID=UPI0033328199